jgi:hypothetical protein
MEGVFVERGRRGTGRSRFPAKSKISSGPVGVLGRMVGERGSQEKASSLLPPKAEDLANERVWYGVMEGI